MVNWLKGGENRTLVTMNEEERRRILKQYFDDEERLKYSDRVITLSRQLSGRMRGRSQHVIGFDNLDVILRNIVSPNQLGPVTITQEEI